MSVKNLFLKTHALPTGTLSWIFLQNLYTWKVRFVIVTPTGLVIVNVKSSLISGSSKHKVLTQTLATLTGVPGVPGTNGSYSRAGTGLPHFKTSLFVQQSFDTSV